MSLSKAEDLLQIIKEQAPRKNPVIKQVGDGHEYVIVLNDGTYIWTPRDWYDRYEDIVVARRSERKDVQR
jgi:hypothetical protein